MIDSLVARAVSKYSKVDQWHFFVVMLQTYVLIRIRNEEIDDEKGKQLQYLKVQENSMLFSCQKLAHSDWTVSNLKKIFDIFWCSPNISFNSIQYNRLIFKEILFVSTSGCPCQPLLVFKKQL